MTATSAHDFTAPEPDEPISIAPFPTLDPAALAGIPGKITEAVMPHTEAHPAAFLIQFLARYGATIGTRPHVWADNRAHPARIYPLIVGKTSDGAKGTSYGAVNALFAAAEELLSGNMGGAHRGNLRSVGQHEPLRRVSGMSSGEGLIEAVRDATGTDPNAKGFDEGVADKRLLIVEQEFVGMLAVMERQGSILPRVVREAWDGEALRTLTRSPMQATDAHIVVIGHVTPGELLLRLKEAQLLGGTMNRFIPIASRRTKLLMDGGNIPTETLQECGADIAESVGEAGTVRRVERTGEATALWRKAYPQLRRARPDGPVASILARAAPQVLRTALAYALADKSAVIEEQHLAAALAIWRYAEDTAEWMFGGEIDTGQVDALVAYIAAGGSAAGRTRTQISSDHFNRNKASHEIGIMLSELLQDGRIRQQVDEPSGKGRPAARYFA